MMHKRPIFAIALFYILGIWAVHNECNLILTGAVAVFAIVLLLCLKKMNVIISALCFAMLILAMITTNVVATKYYNLNKYNSIYAPTDEKFAVAGMVIDEQQTDEYQRLTLKVTEVNDEAASFKMQLYIYDAEMIYTYGDEIIAITKLHEPAPAKFRGDFDTRIFCLSRGLRFIQNTKGDMISFIGNENRISIGRLAFNVRKSMWNSAKNLLPPNEAALAQGIMIGDKSAFTDEMRDNFKASGMAHLTALSGIHINIISMVLFYIIAAASRKRVLLNIFMAIGIIAFYIIVGYTPSILRAVIMALLAIAGNFIWRRSDALNALGISALLILLFVPYALFDVAFQLSFMAVLGMAIFLKPLNIEIIKKSKLTLILPTISVLLTTSIITAYAFNIVNFTAIWANIFVFPLFTFGLFGSYLMSILDAIWQPLGVFASHSVYAALFLMNKIIDISAHYASVYLRVSSPGYIEVAIYSAFLYLVYQIEVAVIKKWLERPSWDLR